MAIPPTIRAVVLLNLQSYGGGRDVWGLPAVSNLERKGMKEPIYDDGMIEASLNCAQTGPESGLNFSRQALAGGLTLPWPRGVDAA